MIAAVWMFLMAGGLAHASEPSLAQPVPLTVVLKFEVNGSSSSMAMLAMERETEKILSPAGVKLDWRMQRDLPEHAEFGRMVEFEMKGHCAMHSFPVLYDERGPLATTFSSDGRLLPFGTVECDRVRESIRHTGLSLEYRITDDALGRALGRVMAHELYHMIAGTKLHTREGLSRPSLAGSELLRPGAALEPEAYEEMRNGLADPR